jgi:hypothetical protein
VIAYYLQNPQAVEEYLGEQEQAAAQTRQEVQSQQETTGLRDRLRRRRTEAVQ